MKKLVVLALSILILAGCKPSDEKAKEIAQREISSVMKDPESVKFRNVKYIKGNDDNDYVNGTVCGEYNAKNGYGAYTGYKPFLINLSMKSKGLFSKGVEYSVSVKNIYNAPSPGEINYYVKTCS
ncbi:hypothetical protein [Klebsiella michiganensis]|uniref:hypothetical protein n=1 Tax=Klebsiella michiganensis TaxID=1134687 RepID=UPI0034A0B290